MRRKRVIDRFHRLYYDVGEHEHGTWRAVSWLGTPVRKLPLDMWLYQEILFELRPGLIVESGTFLGGSASFFASICELIGNGSVLTIDVDAHDERPTHPRIEYVTGSSLDTAVLEHVTERASAAPSTMVVLDSDHTKAHVLRELDAYAGFVTPGQYLVVEDSNVNGRPVLPDFGEGPGEALAEWLPHHPEFEVDRSREKLLFTFNPGGFLRRRA